MIFDIKSLGGLKATDKSKAKSKTSSVGGPSFADMLDEAQGAGEATGMESPVAGVMGGLGVPGAFTAIEEDLPKDAQGQAREMLKTLRSLAEDALSGSPTNTVTRLEALAAEFDESNLTAEQKKALDEVRTRAAVEVAKLKS